MKFVFDGYNYTLRFEKGEQLVDNLTRLIREQELKGGWVVGLGGLSWAELGFYDLNSQEYKWTKIDGPLELTNLTGNVAWNGDEPALHLHATVSDTGFLTRGGHLKEAEVSGTLELFIHRWQSDERLNRSKDEKTSLNLLDL
jgi:predicted DNA-binding protein with PD1-like motif